MARGLLVALVLVWPYALQAGTVYDFGGTSADVLQWGGSTELSGALSVVGAAGEVSLTVTGVASQRVVTIEDSAGDDVFLIQSDNDWRFEDGGTPNMTMQSQWGNSRLHYNIAQDNTLGFTVRYIKARGDLSSFPDSYDKPSSGDEIMGLYGFLFSDAAATTKEGASIRMYVDGEVDTAADTTDVPGRIEFYTTADGTDTPVMQVRISNAGEVRITDLAGTGNDYACVDADGDLYRDDTGCT